MWECQHYRAAVAASHTLKVKTKCFMYSRLHLRHMHFIQVKKKKQLESTTCFGKYRSYNFLLTWKYNNKTKGKNDPRSSWSLHTKMYQNYRRGERPWRFRLWTKKHGQFLTPLTFLALDWVCGSNIKGGENMSKPWVRDSSQPFCAAQGGGLVTRTRKKEAGITLQGRPKTPHWEHVKWSCVSTWIKMMLSTLKPHHPIQQTVYKNWTQQTAARQQSQSEFLTSSQVLRYRQVLLHLVEESRSPLVSSNQINGSFIRQLLYTVITFQ